MTITYQIEKQAPVGTTRKSIFVILRNDTPAVAYRRLEVSLVPIAADPDTYLAAHYTLLSAWDAGTAISLAEEFAVEQSPLVEYYQAILLSLKNDVAANTALLQTLTNAAALVATNAQQAALFDGFRTMLGVGGALGSLTAAQQRQVLVLGLEWAAAGLAVALSLR